MKNMTNPISRQSLAVLASALLLAAPHHSLAGSATWALDPEPSVVWSDALNWTPNTVPNGPEDTATFSVSNAPYPFIIANIEVSSLIFDAGASAFSIDLDGTETLTISGSGITNDSGVTQTIDFLSVDGEPDAGAKLHFTHSATAGALTQFNVQSGYDGGQPSSTSFFDTSSAGSGTFINGGSNGIGRAARGGGTYFYDDSSAGYGTFTNEGSMRRKGGGITQFSDQSTADHGAFTSRAEPAGSGATLFFDNSTAAEGTCYLHRRFAARRFARSHAVLR